MSHNKLIPLLPEDEQKRQNKWFASIAKYSNTFQEDVKQWLSESEELQHNNSLCQSDPAAINEGVIHCPTMDERHRLHP